MKALLPTCSNVCDGVTDFKVWNHQKHKDLNILNTKHFFFLQINKNHLLYIKDYNMAKISFLAGITFEEDY